MADVQHRVRKIRKGKTKVIDVRIILEKLWLLYTLIQPYIYINKVYLMQWYDTICIQYLSRSIQMM